MTNVKELKTAPQYEKDAMLLYLDYIKKQVEADAIESFVMVCDDGTAIQCEAIGAPDMLAVIGMLEVAKHTYIAESCE